VSNSSRAASRRSIRRLIAFGFLLGRGTAPGRLRFLGPKVGTLTAVNGIYFWGGVLLYAIACTEKLFHKQFKQLPTVAEHNPSGFFINQPIVNDPVHQVVQMHELEPTPVS
jgi:hypothetical protein